MRNLAAAVGDLLRSRRMTLSVAESCTGGLVGDLLTNVPGSSDYFAGGVVAYAYEAKTLLLGISQEFLLEHAAVSEPVARAMARRVRERLHTDIGMGVTGIAGPGGGTLDRPVGLVYVALATAQEEIARRYVWSGDRVSNKRASAEAALELLWDYLSRTGPTPVP